MERYSPSSLFRKATAELSDGAFTRGNEVSSRNRSKYNRKEAQDSCQLGMGIVQALLAALSGHVLRITWERRDGKSGELELLSTSIDEKTYLLSWNEREQDLVLGGFENGPTYQVALLLLVISVLDECYARGERSTEVVTRWIELVNAMFLIFPTDYQKGVGWTKEAVASASSHKTLRPLIEKVADALWFRVRYQLPDLTRDLTITLEEGQVFAGNRTGQTESRLPAGFLLSPPERRIVEEPIPSPTITSRNTRRTRPVPALGGDSLFTRGRRVRPTLPVQLGQDDGTGV